MTLRLGLDWTGSTLRAVRPRAEDSLVSFDIFSELTADTLQTGSPEILSVALAIPESETLITAVQLPDMIDWQTRALFELSQSLLEPLETYRVVLEQSPIANQILVALVRKDRLGDVGARIGLNGVREKVNILPRGLALAAGFRAFCSRPNGELLCLVDMVDGHATICLTLSDRPVLYGTLSLADSGVDTTALSRFSIDLRTWVNVHLASLAQHGVSLPLGAVIVSGENSSEELATELTRQFVCPVVPAAWQADRAPLDSDGRPLDTIYLTALGTLAK